MPLEEAAAEYISEEKEVASAEEAIVVTTPQISALRDADKTITLLKSYQPSSVSLVVNKARGDLLVRGESLSPKEISELLKIPLLGVIPDEHLIYAGEFQNLHPAFKPMVNGLLTGKRKLYDVTKKYTGVIGGIRRFLKRSL